MSRRRFQARLRELAKVEALATPITNRVARLVTEAAVEAVKTGRVHIPREPIIEQLYGLMLVAYARRMKSDRSLNLSFATEVRRASSLVGLAGISRGFRDFVGNRLLQFEETATNRLNAELQRISAEQFTTRRSIIEMRRSVADMGLAPNNPSLIETLTRSHSAAAFAVAQYNLNKNNGVITAYQFFTVGDNRVRDEHAELDGKIFSVHDAVNYWPPLGWNCRCQMVELVDPVEPDEIPGSALAAAVDDNFGFRLSDLVD